MKQIILTSVMMVMVHVLLGQRVDRDPTYSVSNYKHPNKAAYARTHNLDRVVRLKKRATAQNDNYKQGFNKPVSVERFAIKSSASNISNTSSKHPYGL